MAPMTILGVDMAKPGTDRSVMIGYYIDDTGAGTVRPRNRFMRRYAFLHLPTRLRKAAKASFKSKFKLVSTP